MALYKALYFQLFAAVADAQQALAQQNIVRTNEILILAQQEAEQHYLDALELQSTLSASP